MGNWIKRSPEIMFTAVMVGILLMLSYGLSLPVLLPSGNRAAFVGIHYLYPLIGVAIWGMIAYMGQRRQLGKVFLVALPCYATIIWVHFNIKLWSPLINPHLWDDQYWLVDQSLRPLVNSLFFLHEKLSWLFPVDGNFYMIGFIAMFYISFCYHAVQGADIFRKMFLAALFFQGLGALCYLAFPALGPFLFEQGSNVRVSEGQASMLEVHRNIVEHGSVWLAAHGSTYLTAGLAAMPSLHAGGTFLFFLFARKYARVLLPFYALMLFYILMAAVTTRWHYLIDLPVGMMLAWVSMALAEKLVDGVKENSADASLDGRLALA